MPPHRVGDENISLHDFRADTVHRQKWKAHAWGEHEVQQDLKSPAAPQPTNRQTLSQSFAMWNPIALNTWVVAGFVFIYVIIFVALEVLYRLSQRHRGISTTTQDRHYYWTYGLTAFLTIVTSLYHRVDFRICQLQP